MCRIEMVAGTLTDHYDPKNDVMRLSSQVYNGTSIASVSIAAHESGHAIQDGTAYGFLKFRNAIAPVVSIVSTASWPLLIIGLFIIWQGNLSTGNFIFNLGVIFFITVVLFHTVTLPVEINASRRAVKQLLDLGIIDAGEVRGAKKSTVGGSDDLCCGIGYGSSEFGKDFIVEGRD